VFLGQQHTSLSAPAIASGSAAFRCLRTVPRRPSIDGAWLTTDVRRYPIAACGSRILP
jgi:hypothetical protein